MSEPKVQVKVMVTPSDKRRLEDAADGDNRSLSNFCESILLDALEASK